MTAGQYVAETFAGDQARTVYLGGTVSQSRRLALRWLRGQARRFADALDPEPFAPWVHPAALRPVTHAERDAPAELRAWTEDDEYQDQAMQRLAEGLTFTFVAHDDTAWYALVARPLTVPAQVFTPNALVTRPLVVPALGTTTSPFVDA